MIVQIVAWVAIFLAVAGALLTPSMEGMPRPPFGKGSARVAFIQALILLILAGRALNWW